MAAHGTDLPSEPCAVCGGLDCAHIPVTYDPRSPFLIYDQHPPVQAPQLDDPPPPRRRRSDNRARHLQETTAHGPDEDR